MSAAPTPFDDLLRAGASALRSGCTSRRSATPRWCAALAVAVACAAAASGVQAQDAGAPSPLAGRLSLLPQASGSLVAPQAAALRERPTTRWMLAFDGANRSRVDAGFLRMNTDAASTLALRPRGGGLMLAYRSQF